MKEEDAASQERLENLRAEIATTQEKLDGMKANWQNERGAIDLVQDLKSQIEDAKTQMERVTREGDLAQASELRFPTLPPSTCSLRWQTTTLTQVGFFATPALLLSAWKRSTTSFVAMNA